MCFRHPILIIMSLKGLLLLTLKEMAQDIENRLGELVSFGRDAGWIGFLYRNVVSFVDQWMSIDKALRSIYEIISNIIELLFHSTSCT